MNLITTMDSTEGVSGSLTEQRLWVNASSLYDPQELFHACVAREDFLTSRMRDVILSFYSSRAQLLPLTFYLEMSGENKLQFTQFDRLHLLSPGAHLHPTSIPHFLVHLPVSGHWVAFTVWLL